MQLTPTRPALLIANIDQSPLMRSARLGGLMGAIRVTQSDIIRPQHDARVGPNTLAISQIKLTCRLALVALDVLVHRHSQLSRSPTSPSLALPVGLGSSGWGWEGSWGNRAAIIWRMPVLDRSSYYFSRLRYNASPYKSRLVLQQKSSVMRLYCYSRKERLTETSRLPPTKTVLYVIHRVCQLGMHLSRFNPSSSIRRDRRSTVRAFEQFVHVNSLTRAKDVGVVCWRAYADRFGRPAEEIAHFVSDLLKSVCCLPSEATAEHFVKKNCIVRRAGGA